MDLVRRLRAMRERSTSARIFAAPHGGKLHDFTDRFRQAVRVAGLAGTDLTPHVLRHTWATEMVETGCDLVQLMQLGGWANLAMVQRYAHARPERAMEATARMLTARDV